MNKFYYSPLTDTMWLITGNKLQYFCCDDGKWHNSIFNAFVAKDIITANRWELVCKCE
jgi:hypothetical protein